MKNRISSLDWETSVSAGIAPRLKFIFHTCSTFQMAYALGYGRLDIGIHIFTSSWFILTLFHLSQDVQGIQRISVRIILSNASKINTPGLVLTFIIVCNCLPYLSRLCYAKQVQQRNSLVSDHNILSYFRP